MPSMRSTYGMRRFSLDSGDDLLLSSTPQSIDLHPAPAPVTPSLLPSYPSVMPSRRRAMTSNALMGASGLDMDDSLLGDFNPEEAFESSQGPLSRSPSLPEPLFLPSHRASSLSLEPDVFGASHTLGSTADYPHSFRTYHYMPMNHLGYDHSMDLQGDLFDDRFSTPSFHPPRSFSDVDMTTLPDSFDLPKPPRMGPSGLDSARPRLLKHNSVSSIRSSHDDVFALPPAPSPAHGAQVVKGSFHAAVADSPSSTSPVAPPAVPAATPAAPVASVVAAPVPPAAPLLPVSRSSEGHHKERGGKKSAAGKMGGCRGGA